MSYDESWIPVLQISILSIGLKDNNKGSESYGYCSKCPYAPSKDLTVQYSRRPVNQTCLRNSRNSNEN